MKRLRTHRVGGFSLLEAVTVLVIFGLLSVAALSVFAFGSRGFQQAVLRQGLLGESEAIRRKLAFDFKPSHQNTLEVVARKTTLSSGDLVSRDAVSFVTLSDWRNPANFTAAGLPRWDRYVVYYPTTEESGKLVRQIVDPGPLPGPIPYADLDTNIGSNPVGNSNVLQTTILSHNVLSLEIDRNDERQLLELTLRLRARGARRVNSGAKVDEVQESVFSLEALNTFPRL